MFRSVLPLVLLLGLTGSVQPASAANTRSETPANETELDKGVRNLFNQKDDANAVR